MISAHVEACLDKTKSHSNSYIITAFSTPTVKIGEYTNIFLIGDAIHSGIIKLTDIERNTKRRRDAVQSLRTE